MIKNFSAIILRTRDWGEKDLLVCALSQDGERLDLIAKGAGGPRSKRRSHLESMNAVRGTIYESKGRAYIKTVETENSFLRVKQEPCLVFRLTVFVEILEKTLLPEHAHPEIYPLFLETLESLNEKNHPLLTEGELPKNRRASDTILVEVALVKLAHVLGYLPSFKNCAHCHEGLTKTAHWDHEAGTLACANCRQANHRSFPIKYCKAFEFFRHASTENCQKVFLQPDEAETLREWIPSFFSLHLKQPLKSLQIQEAF